MLLTSDLHSKSSYTRQQYLIKLYLMLARIYSWFPEILHTSSVAAKI